MKALEGTFQNGEGPLMGACSRIVKSSRRVLDSSSAVTCCLGLTFSHLGPGLKHFACLLSFSCNLRRAARHPAVFRLQRPEAGDKNWWIKLHAHYGAKHAGRYLAGGIWGTVNNVVLSTHMLYVCVMIMVAWCIWSFTSAKLKANQSAVMKTVNNQGSILLTSGHHG